MSKMNLFNIYILLNYINMFPSFRQYNNCVFYYTYVYRDNEQFPSQNRSTYWYFTEMDILERIT